MPCLPLYRLLMAAALLTGTITASRPGPVGPGGPCRDAQTRPCARTATPPTAPVQPARGTLAALRTAS